MSRGRTALAVAALVAAVVTGALVWSSTSKADASSDLVLAGDVRAQEWVVRAPRITTPTIDFAVGISRSSSPGGRPPASARPLPQSRTPMVSGYLADVRVTEGMRVTRGQVAATLDTTLLDLGVRQAETAKAKAGADLAVLDQNVETLGAARAKLVKARAGLVKAKRSLETSLTAFIKVRSNLEASITAIETVLSHGPPPPSNPPLPVLLASLRNALAGVQKGIAGMKAGLAKIDKGLAQMKKALSQLDTARARLHDLREILLVNEQAQDVGVRLAEARRAQAVMTAPCSGIITFARRAGTVAMVGAPIVRIRPDGPTEVFTYVTPDVLSGLSTGASALVDFDSNDGPALPARVSRIDDVAAFPPTSFATGVVHMTRTVRVTLTLDGGATAPPGTPVDVTIRMGR
jgi:multidrug resistance efflux pump